MTSGEHRVGVETVPEGLENPLAPARRSVCALPPVAREGRARSGSLEQVPPGRPEEEAHQAGRGEGGRKLGDGGDREVAAGHGDRVKAGAPVLEGVLNPRGRGSKDLVLGE